MEIILTIIILALIALLVILGFKNHIHKKRTQEMGVSLSLISEENKKLKNENAKHFCNEQTLDPYEVYIANEIKPLLNEPGC